MKKLITILISLCCITGSAFSQDFEKEMKTIVSNYTGITAYEMQLEYRLYKNHSSSQVSEEKTASVIRDGNNYYSDVFGIITIVNEKYMVFVDNEHEMVMIDKMSKERLQNNEITIHSDTLMDQLQKLMIPQSEKWIQKTQYEKSGPGEGLYTINFNYGDYRMQKVYFNTKDHTITKTVYYYETEMPIEDGKPAKPRLEVIYKKFIKGSPENKDVFSEQKYLAVNKKGDVTLNNGYSRYTVINHLLSADDYQRLYDPKYHKNYE